MCVKGSPPFSLAKQTEKTSFWDILIYKNILENKKAQIHKYFQCFLFHYEEGPSFPLQHLMKEETNTTKGWKQIADPIQLHSSNS